MSRDLALTMPAVTVFSSPNGEPIAITHSPTRSLFGSPMRDRRQAGRFDLDQCDVGARVGADQLALELAPIGRRDRDVVGATHDVRVGHHVAIRRQDEARTEAARNVAARRRLLRALARLRLLWRIREEAPEELEHRIVLVDVRKRQRALARRRRARWCGYRRPPDRRDRPGRRSRAAPASARATFGCADTSDGELRNATSSPSAERQGEHSDSNCEFANHVCPLDERCGARLSRAAKFDRPRNRAHRRRRHLTHHRHQRVADAARIRGGRPMHLHASPDGTCVPHPGVGSARIRLDENRHRRETVAKIRPASRRRRRCGARLRASCETRRRRNQPAVLRSSRPCDSRCARRSSLRSTMPAAASRDRFFRRYEYR